jgi:hypothetical protein
MLVRPALLVALALSSLAALTGCASREAVGQSSLAVLGPGVVNNPGNKSLRFDLLKFGLERFCEEMNRRGAPLKLNEGQPVTGRFYAESCQSQAIDDESRQSFVVKFSGKGYAWNELLGRIGFTSSGLVEYAADFRLKDGAMYVYFRPRRIDAAAFQTLMVESAAAQVGMTVSGVNADEAGRRIVTGQLERGFTVIRYGTSGETDFGVGIVPVGGQPYKPFQISGSDKLTLANERTEVPVGQQDIIGGFEITRDGQALYLTMSLDGAAGADVFVLPKPVGDRMVEQYVRQRGAAPMDAPPLLDEALVPGPLWKRFVPLNRGLYYLVLDHSGSVGRTHPPASSGAAKIDYLVQVGERP